MSDRIKFLYKNFLKITTLNNLIDKGKLDNAILKLRMSHLMDLYHAYEDYNDELAQIQTTSNRIHEYSGPFLFSRGQGRKYFEYGFRS